MFRFERNELSRVSNHSIRNIIVLLMKHTSSKFYPIALKKEERKRERENNIKIFLFYFDGEWTYSRDPFIECPLLERKIINNGGTVSIVRRQARKNKSNESEKFTKLIPRDQINKRSGRKSHRQSEK